MTRDEIYNHLAQVYLGKKNEIKEQKKPKNNSWLVINIAITVMILATSIYGLTAFLTRRSESVRSRIIYALNNGPIRLQYNLEYPYPPVKAFSLSVAQVNARKYRGLQFSMRGMEGRPGVVRVEVRNQKNERASVFVDGVQSKWKEFNVPLEEFRQISDWSTINEVSFIIESWNAEKKQGTVLIDNVCFSI